MLKLLEEQLVVAPDAVIERGCVKAAMVVGGTTALSDLIVICDFLIGLFFVCWRRSKMKDYSFHLVTF